MGILSSARSFVAAAMGGHVTAALAGRAHLRHAVVLAGIGVSLAIYALVVGLHQEPLW